MARRAEDFHHAHDTLFGAKIHGDRPDQSAGTARLPKIKAGRIHADAKRHAPRRKLSIPPKNSVSIPGSSDHPCDPGWKLPSMSPISWLMEYARRPSFGCPAHDQRDLDFVNKYGLGNTPVVARPESIQKPSSSPTPPMTATAA